MKKLLVLTSVLALAACGQDYNKYDAMFEGCERIETTKVHLIYKCPADQEWVKEVKKLQPNGIWRAGGNFNLDEMYADEEHVYTEVSLNDESGFCKEDFTIRTMIAKPFDGGNNWAFIGCK